MSELNREQIIKALECCTTSETTCEDCPLDSNKTGFAMCDIDKLAFALIKELTAENDAISERYAIQVVTAIELDKQVKKLTEENERLKANEKSATEILNFKFAYDAGKSDTLQKVEEWVKENSFQEDGCGWDCIYVKDIVSFIKELGGK